MKNHRILSLLMILFALTCITSCTTTKPPPKNQVEAKFERFIADTIYKRQHGIYTQWVILWVSDRGVYVVTRFTYPPEYKKGDQIHGFLIIE